MKKTHTVNISGIIFHIDEDAYEKLNAYLSRVKRHFEGSEGKDEIISDIESRIAEIFKERTSDRKEVVTIEDVDEAIKVMGEPKQFDDEEKSHETSEETETGSFYDGTRPKRLYRDPDHRVLGGVCAGIGAYFNIDPVWIRILFIILLFTGFGILLYILLWVVIPMAKTTAEKLEMKGEKVNISNIEKSINEEIDHLKSKINDLRKEAKQTFGKKKSNDEIDRLGNFFEQLIKLTLRVIIVFVGFVLVIVGLALLTAFLVMLFADGSYYFPPHIGLTSFSIIEFLQIFTQTATDSWILLLSVLLLVGIPVLGIIFGGFKMLFGIKGRNRAVSGFMSFLWISSFIAIIVIGVRTWNNFSYKDEATETKSIMPGSSRTYYVQLNENRQSLHHHDKIHFDDVQIVMKDHKVLAANLQPGLELYTSNSDSIKVEIIKKVRYGDRIDKNKRLNAINYSYKITDSLLILDRFFSINELQNWGFQEMEINLYIPKGLKVVYDKELDKISPDNDIKMD